MRKVMLIHTMHKIDGKINYFDGSCQLVSSPDNVCRFIMINDDNLQQNRRANILYEDSRTHIEEFLFGLH